MKGLIYKDIVINKINLLGLGAIVLYIAFSMTMYMSDDAFSGDNSLVAMTLICSIFALNISFPTIFIDCSSEDSKTKWTNYAMALPGGYKRMLLVKYVLGAIGQMLAVLLSCIIIFVCKIALGIAMGAPFMLLLAVVAVMLIHQALILPFILRGRMALLQIIMLVLFIGILLGGFAYLALGDISFLTKGNLLQRFLLWVNTNESKIWLCLSGLAGIGVLAEVVSYYIAVLLYRRD